MKAFRICLNSEQETIRFASRLSALLKPADIVCLVGDLGAGKTTFVKGLAQGLRIRVSKVCSPTFVLMNLYEGGRLALYHFDLYRLSGAREISALGTDEFFYGDGVSVVEWADRLGDLAPPEHLLISLAHKSETQRLMTLEARGERYKEILKKIHLPQPQR